MHGYDARSVLVVNAEIGLMGGVGIDTKTSPRRAAIEKVQDELRQEYDVIEERRRELEFLQKGGNPLEFRFGHAVSTSVQSTSPTDQQVDQFGTSEAKGSFGFTASPHGDSVESSGRPGDSQLCEPNSADNLNLFDGENKLIEGERTSRCLSRNNIAPLGKSTQIDGNQNVKELGNSVALGVPRKAYKRRYRTKTSRDGSRSNSNDVLTRGGHGFSLPSYCVTNDSKGLVSDAEKQWGRNITGQPTSSNGGVTSKTVPSNKKAMVEPDTIKSAEPMTEMSKVCKPNDAPDVIFSTVTIHSQHNQRAVAHESPTEVSIKGTELLSEKEKVGFGGLETQLSDLEKVDDQVSSRQMNGFSGAKVDRKRISSDSKHISAEFASKGLDSSSSCTQTSLSHNEKKDSEICTEPINIYSTVNNMTDQSYVSERDSVLENNIVKDVKVIKADEICGFVSEECYSVQKNHKDNGFEPQLGDGLIRNESTLQSETKDEVIIIGKESIGAAASETEVKPCISGSVNSNNQDTKVCHELPGSFDSSVPYHTKVAELVRISSVAHERNQSEIKIKFVTRADEDSILEEARIIEAKRKRITKLSSVTTSIETRHKSHWDFVLEEMSWLANDFLQERLWKTSAACQISYHAAFSYQFRYKEINDSWKQKKLAHTLAKAVMDFWHSVKGMNKKAELQCPKKAVGHDIQEYAMKFLKCNSLDVPHSQAEAPTTPERVSETKEILFYTVPVGATETYRKSIEFQVLQRQKTRTNMKQEVETSACDAMAGSQDYACEEIEGEATMYDMSAAFCGSSSSRLSKKKRRFQMHTYGGKSDDMNTDLSLTQCMENKVGSQQSMPHLKRPTTSLNVSFPTKRVRTCYRPRVRSPFSAGTSGLQVSTKTDASSETSSFQDDQSSLHGGSYVPNSVEVESVRNFEKHLKLDSAEVSMKRKKKKKAKNLGFSYEQRWTADSNFQNEQGGYSRKRSANHQFESKGCNGIFGQHVPKKPKIMRQSFENTSDNISPTPGPVPSPSASQLCSMPNTNKFTKMLTGRDLSKVKNLKMPAGMAGSGSQWSPFEDQALVVLVHDMGPNWELVSDAINSTLHFKCIYRKPMECKERHKLLMVTNGDGADSAEDPGTSQPYPSTLPGIPKGSARQLFQRLLGPVEEASRNSHFEKIIMIGRKYLLGKSQVDDQDPKQLQQPHSSHTIALSQVAPNNLNGLILTPLDLCDAPSSSPDISSLGYQNPHPVGLPASMSSGANSATLQGSLNVIHGNNFSSPSSSLNATFRDGKYAISRSTSMPNDEQHRIHHSNQLLPEKNISVSSTPGAFSGPEHGGVHVLPSGSGMGIISGITRGMPTPRPGFQGFASPSMLNSGSLASSGMVTMPTPVNVHCGQTTSMSRPVDNLNMMRPTQTQETQRQMMLAELQIQAAQVNSRAVPPPFGGLTSSCPNQTPSSHVPSYPPQHHQPSRSPLILSPLHSHAQAGAANHAPNNAQKLSYALHLTKERQLQQQLVHHKQRFGTSNSLTPSAQQHQSPLHNSAQITSLSVSPPASLSSLASLSPSVVPPGHSRSAQGGPTNQLNKQQQQQQTSRSHPQQRQPSAKVLKGVGRANALNQHMQMDPSALNQSTSNLMIIATEKGGNQMTNSMQNQGSYTGSAVNSIWLTKSSVEQPQQKMHPGRAATKPLKPTASHSDSMEALESTSPAANQAITTPVISSSCDEYVPHPQSQ
ncbi:unnamed protein product [Cuscuta europaea]|uniref:Uncharacterized protein n=1 Tax=Cuscuta europaea TaxID=41803 RepID=A0A9P0YT86_CUSEU|nr:unnamed protein product [Cuscuta europaea]